MARLSPSARYGSSRSATSGPQGSRMTRTATRAASRAEASGKGLPRISRGQAVASPGASISRNSIPSISVDIKPTTGASDGEGEEDAGPTDQSTLPKPTESDLDPDPFRQFGIWLDEATASGGLLPNAMALATADADGVPSCRTVLLRSFDEQGFTFFTNYDSRKGGDLAVNPRAALLFFWENLERQVRITGRVSRISREETAEYFKTRPRDSQLGAWVSPQSRVIPHRRVLEENLESLAAQYEGDLVPVPPFWGGYRVAPDTIEFWQGRPRRLHDRLLYTRSESGWTRVRLAP